MGRVVCNVRVDTLRRDDEQKNLWYVLGPLHLCERNLSQSFKKDMFETFRIAFVKKKLAMFIDITHKTSERSRK